MAVINSNGIQNKYLKNKIINTDISTGINFTILAIIIVQITSVIENTIPIDIFDLLFIKDILKKHFSYFDNLSAKLLILFLLWSGQQDLNL